MRMVPLPVNSGLPGFCVPLHAISSGDLVRVSRIRQFEAWNC
jgi:hypothetical protein